MLAKITPGSIAAFGRRRGQLHGKQRIGLVSTG